MCDLIAGRVFLCLIILQTTLGFLKMFFQMVHQPLFRFLFQIM